MERLWNIITKKNSLSYTLVSNIQYLTVDRCEMHHFHVKIMQISLNQLQGAQKRTTTRQFAQWNRILSHLQHSKLNILDISIVVAQPFQRLKRLSGCIAAELHVYWNLKQLFCQC